MKKLIIASVVAIPFLVIPFVLFRDEDGSGGSGAAPDTTAKSQVDARRDHRKRTDAPDSSGPPPAGRADASDTPGLTPDGAKRLMEDTRRISDINRRAEACSAIIENLCKSGYPEEAWNLIEPGNGQVRKWQLSAFFRTAQVSDEMLYRKCGELSDANEVTFGIRGMIARHLDGDWVKFLTSGGFKAFQKSMKDSGLPINLNQSLSPSLQAYISDNGGKDVAGQRDRLASVMDAYGNKLIDSATLGEVLKAAHVLSPEQKLESMNHLTDLGPVNGSLQIYRKRLIADLVRKNPEEMISNTLKSPPGQQSSRDIATAIRSWISADSQAAADWYALNSASLSSFQKDSAAGAYYLVAMEDGDHQTAGKWIEEMKDPGRKAEAERMLEGALLKEKQGNAAPGQDR